MLKQILDTLEQRGGLTVGELAIATRIPSEVLVGMLDTLARQGRIEWQRSAGGERCRTAAPPVVALSLPKKQNPRPSRG